MTARPGVEQNLIPDELLHQSSARHQHLCPKQVLGLRMGLLGGKLLGLDVPRTDKRLLVIAETDGCAADGLAVASGTSVGRRTLRVMDYGKVAATFVDVETGRAIRLVPRRGVREIAVELLPEAKDRWHAQLAAYQFMPDDLLLHWQAVTLTTSIEKILSKPDHKVTCSTCGEDIINEREVVRAGVILCRTCAGDGYYTTHTNGKTHS